MVTYSELVASVENKTQEFLRIYKCLKKKDLPSSPTKAAHLKNIVKQYNGVSEIFSKFYEQVSPIQKQEFLNRFDQLRDKLISLFEFLSISVAIPETFHAQVVLRQRNDTTFFFDFDLNLEFFIAKMTEDAATAKAKFINAYSRIIPDFDGTPENLTRFIDACELLNENVGGHMSSAVTIIKTKLIGTARSYVTNEDTIAKIVDVLKENIKPESSKLVSSKLLGLKQGNKSPNDYVKEIENLSASLKRAFLSEGVPVATAEKYSVEAVVKAVAFNSNNETVKSVLRSADFKTISDVTTKFMSATTDEATNKASVFYYKRSGSHRGRKKGYRGGYQGHRGGANYGNHNDRNYDNRGQNEGYRSGNGYLGYGRRQNNYRGSRGNNQNVRYTENSAAPQVTLGATLDGSTQ